MLGVLPVWFSPHQPSPPFPTQALLWTIKVFAFIYLPDPLCCFPLANPYSLHPKCNLKTNHWFVGECREEKPSRNINFSTAEQTITTVFLWRFRFLQFSCIWMQEIICQIVRFVIKAFQWSRGLGSPGFAATQDLRGCFARQRIKSSLSWSANGAQTVSSFWPITTSPQNLSIPKISNQQLFCLCIAPIINLFTD